MSFRLRPVAGTTRRGYDLANILEERVRDGSPEFRYEFAGVRLVKLPNKPPQTSEPLPNYLYIHSCLLN